MKKQSNIRHKAQPKELHYAPVIFCTGNTHPNEHQSSDLATLHAIVPPLHDTNKHILHQAVKHLKETEKKQRKEATKKEADARQMMLEVGQRIVEVMVGENI